jgi:hypothetical protein
VDWTCSAGEHSYAILPVGLTSVEAAWTLLEFDSYRVLHGESSASNQAMRIQPQQKIEGNPE